MWDKSKVRAQPPNQAAVHVMISFIKNLFTEKMELAEYNKGHSFRLTGISFDQLTGCIAQLPDVVFTRKRKFLWSLERCEADFNFQDYTFAIETDDWDGALWVVSKTGTRPVEMQKLREQIELNIILPRVAKARAA